MSSDRSHATTLHSDASQRHDIVASSPPLIPVIPQGDRFTSFQSHRRANTEYIARPPIFEEDTNDSIPSDESVARPNPPRVNTFQKKKLEARAQVLSDWFQGKSDPVDLGIRVRPDGLPDTLAMETPHQRAMSVQHARKASTTPGSGRFSFFGLRRQAEQRPPEPADDEFLNLDISAALSLPSSHATPDDALDTLREQATTVIQHMQEAYKQRTFAMHQALANESEKQEELEDTRARIDHFKAQLDGMAAKVMDQEKAMQAMADELEEERRQRKREQSRSRSRMVRAIPPEDEIPSLVLQTPNRGSKRASHGTLTSDSGFESGDESVADSVFSHREGIESPTSILTAPSPSLSQVAMSTPNAGPTPTQKNLVAATTAPTPVPARSSAYDRVIKGLAATRLGSSFVGNTNQANPCKNCHGVPASEAWGVMGILKDENRGLKTRVGELELVIDDCLSMVGP